MELLDISSLGKSSEMLDEDRFWNIVAISLDGTKNEAEQEKATILDLISTGMKKNQRQ